MESRELSMQVMQKILTTTWFFITCLLIFYAAILSYLSHIFILFLNQFYSGFLFYCNFFNPPKTTYICRSLSLDKVPVEDTRFYLTATPCWGFCYLNAILIVFYQCFIILSTINKEIIIIIIIIINVMID